MTVFCILSLCHALTRCIWRWRDLLTGATVRTDRACSVDPEADPAVRDSAGPSRYDGARSGRGWQDQLHPRADEGVDRVWSRSQGDADEPQGNHRTADVRSSRRRDQWLDRRHFLNALEKNAQNKEGVLLSSSSLFYCWWRMCYMALLKKVFIVSRQSFVSLYSKISFDNLYSSLNGSNNKNTNITRKQYLTKERIGTSNFLQHYNIGNVDINLWMRVGIISLGDLNPKYNLHSFTMSWCIKMWSILLLHTSVLKNI